METVSATDTHGKKKNICIIKATNTPEKGLEFYLQSDMNFQLFANPSDKYFNLGGVKCFFPRNGDASNLNGVNGYFSTGSDKFQVENMLNLSLLLARDLKAGVTFNFGIMPIGEEKIAEYLTHFRNQVKMIYLSYMKPVSIRMDITTQVIEYYD